MSQRYFKRGINMPLYVVANPLPEATLWDLMVRAGVDEMFYGEFPGQYFAHNWKYSAGLEMENVSWGPGEERILPEDIAEMVIRELGEQGMVMYPQEASEAEVEHARLAGIQRAQRFWAERGHRRVIAYQRNQNFSDDQVAQYKSEIWKYYVNQAAADLLMEKLQEGKNAPSTARPVNDEDGSSHASAGDGLS